MTSLDDRFFIDRVSSLKIKWIFIIRIIIDFNMSETYRFLRNTNVIDVRRTKSANRIGLYREQRWLFTEIESESVYF